MPGVTKISYTKGSRGHLETSGILRCAARNRNSGAIDTGRGMHRGPEIHGISGFYKVVPYHVIYLWNYGFVYKWPKFFFGLTGEIFFRPTKKRPYFTPMFITIVGTHLVKCPIHPAVDSLKKKSPFILEFPIYLDPADSYLWRRLTVPKNPKMFFWGQICKLANWKRVV